MASGTEIQFIFTLFLGLCLDKWRY